ncbi:MAG TPA: hypothetical protein VJ727_06780 [Rhodanobacteraceae bacterium]|nr:hypothetical protein [Rhodanobacteraceae bacterium]
MTGRDDWLDELELSEVESRRSLDDLPPWAPSDVVKVLPRLVETLPVRTWNDYVRLLTDERMRAVWNWHAVARSNANRTVFGSALGFCSSVERACRLPGKPGNLSAAKRKKYFQDVRRHAKALIALLEGTRYSSNSERYDGMSTTEIEPERLAEVVARDLRGWGDDELGHVVAYWIDEEGVSRLPWTYPHSHLYDLLHDVLEWTEEDDGWDWNLGLSSSKPLEHAQASNARIVYFTCTLYKQLARFGLKIPFSHLATVANVALGLPYGEQLDEDTVRKQVRRYEARAKEEAASAPKRDNPF